MNKKQLKDVFASYYGIGSSGRGENARIEMVDVSDVDDKVDIRIPWEEHIGNLSGVARISPRDVLFYAKLPLNEKNIEKAVEIMKKLAKKYDLYLVKDDKGRYLLINPNYRR